jgi:hypothetical protein
LVFLTPLQAVEEVWLFLASFTPLASFLFPLPLSCFALDFFL